MLFDRERIFSRLEDNTWTQIAGPEKYMALDFVRFWITAYPGAKPSEARRLVFSDRRIPPVEHETKTLFGYGNPNAPNQVLRTAGHRYLQATPDVTFSIVDDTDIVGQPGSGGAFVLG